jgi:hypothetical protein
MDKLDLKKIKIDSNKIKPPGIFFIEWEIFSKGKFGGLAI